MEVVGNININFSVFSESPLYLNVADLSDWVYAKNLPSYILINTPGSKKPKTFTFNKERINVFNSHNLGLSCLKADCEEENYIDLPDGIYTICIKSSYEGIEDSKFYLKTDRFEIEYAKVMIKDGLEYEQDFVMYMTRVKFMLEAAKSYAKLGDFVRANRSFEISKNLLKKHVECSDCLK